MLQTGQYARFKNPNADELTPAGRSITMKILEVDAPRALVEFQIDAQIKPTARVMLDALVPVFKEFPAIDIPEFLNTPEWIDLSWGNDVTAHVERVLPSDSSYELWVYVHPDDPAERESPEYKKYAIVIYDKTTGDESLLNHELDTYEADDPETAQACINDAIDRIMLIITNGRNNQDAE